jgi:hypothetical protein
MQSPINIPTKPEDPDFSKVVETENLAVLFWEQSLPEVKVLSENLSIQVNLKEGTLKFFNQAKELVEYSAV